MSNLLSNKTLVDAFLFPDKKSIGAFLMKLIGEEDPKNLLEVNKESCEYFFKNHNVRSFFNCEALHPYFIAMAKDEGMDVSECPEELDYMEVRN